MIVKFKFTSPANSHPTLDVLNSDLETIREGIRAVHVTGDQFEAEADVGEYTGRVIALQTAPRGLWGGTVRADQAECQLAKLQYTDK